jgi:hypothetical protein
LKHVLGDIQTDRGNLHLDGSLHAIRQRRSPYGTSMPGAGAVHRIKTGPEHVQQTISKPDIACPFRAHLQSVYFDVRASSGTAVAPPINGSVGAFGGQSFLKFDLTRPAHAEPRVMLTFIAGTML